MQDPFYISPAEYWASLEDLAPLSEEETALISKWLSTPQYLGLDKESFSLNEIDGRYVLDKNSAFELINFLSNILNSGFKQIEVERESVYEYGEWVDDVLKFSKSRDPQKFSVEKGRDLRKIITNERKDREQKEKASLAAIKREQKINVVLKDFQEGNLDKENFLKQIAELQK